MHSKYVGQIMVSFIGQMYVYSSTSMRCIMLYTLKSTNSGKVCFWLQCIHIPVFTIRAW